MKKLLLAFCMLLVGVITSQATSLFPFFGDLVGNYDTLKDSDNQFVAKGVSMLGDIEATESFMAAAGSPTATTCLSADALRSCIDSLDARIGVAVIIEGRDTVTVAGRDDFPMLSVYKFPQALAVADYCIANGVAFEDTIDIQPAQIKENTWSPLREKYGIKALRIPLEELLSYTLQQGDNNACDILFDFIGGPAVADSLMHARGFCDIHIRDTEEAMHSDVMRCYRNSSTPLEMARLMEYFMRDLRLTDARYAKIATLMTDCRTGLDRLAAPLQRTSAVLTHKTGTGDLNPSGRQIAVNDVGYVTLPDGRSYSIVVFIADSALKPMESASVIATLSRVVYNCLASASG